MKKNKGITLIALVVTIIVLIILAGISVNLLLGQNGLLQRAKDVAAQQEKAELVEQMRLALTAKQIDTKGTLTQEDIEEVLGTYGTVSDGNVTTTKGGYVIQIAEVYNGKKVSTPVTAEWAMAVGGDKDSSNSVTIGDLVQPNILLGTSYRYLAKEKFYVIGKDDEEGTLTLLAEKCVKTNDEVPEKNIQSSGLLFVRFNSNSSESNANVYSESDIKGDVDTYVGKLIQAGLTLEDVEINPDTHETAKGRLMWGTNSSGEVNDLLNLDITNKLDIVYGPSGLAIKYWLGSPRKGYSGYVWFAFSRSGGIISTTVDQGTDFIGLRPVIKVLQSKVTSETVMLPTEEWEMAIGGDKDSSNSVTVGDLVQPTNETLSEEKFYVIKKDDITGTVTLIAEKCVKTSSGTGQYTQMDNAGTLAYDSSSNVYYDGTTNPITQASIKTHLDTYVAKFTTAGMTLQDVEINSITHETAKGRLLLGTDSSGEVNDLLTLTTLTNRTDIVYGPSSARVNYWLGSPDPNNLSCEWYVYNGGVNCYTVSYNNYFRSSTSYRSITI